MPEALKLPPIEQGTGQSPRSSPKGPRKKKSAKAKNKDAAASPQRPAKQRPQKSPAREKAPQQNQEDRELEELFSIADTDGSGLIDCREIGDLLRYYGCNPSKATIATILQSLGMRDANFGAHTLTKSTVAAAKSGAVTKNDHLTLAEFKTFMLSKKVKELKEGPPSEKIHDLIAKAFNFFDKNDDGNIGWEELANGLKTMGETMSNKEVQDVVKVNGHFIETEQGCFYKLNRIEFSNFWTNMR